MQQSENKHQPINEIKASENELTKYRDRLEELVKERTAELEKAKEVLEQQDKERKKVMESLWESEQLLRSITSAAKDAIVMADRLGNISYWNPAAENMFGYHEDEVIGESLIGTVFSCSSVEVSRKRLEQFGKTGTDPAVGETFEMQAKRKDDTEFPIEVSLSRVKIRDQWYSVGIMRDITERKEAEEAVLESEEKYRSLYESVHAGIILQSVDGKIIHANKIACQIFGMTTEQIMDKTSIDPEWQMIMEDGTLVSGEDHPSMITIRTGEPVRDAVRGLFAGDTNKIRWLHINTEPLINHATGKMDKVVITFHDITKRKKAEESLRESENRYEAVVDNASESIVVVQDKKLRFVNPAVMASMDYTEEELTSHTFIEFVHPDDREQIMAIHLNRNKGEEVPPVYELRLLDKQGNAKWVENNGVLIEWEGRAATLNFLRDVTERKKAEEKLKESEKRYRNFIKFSIQGVARWEFEKPLPTQLPFKEQIKWTMKNLYVAECNDVLANMYGYANSDEATGKSLIEFWNNENTAREIIELWIKSNYEWVNQETHEITKEGLGKFFLNNLVSVIEDNKVVCLWATQIDITERKQIEETLKNKSIEYKRAQEIGKIGSFTVDFITREQKWSDEIFHILGLEPDEIQPSLEVFIECVHPEDKELLIQKSSETFAGKADLDHQYRIIQKDGEVRFIHTQAKVENGQDGTPLRIYGFSQDITERKKAEVELKENEERFRSLSNAAFEGIVITKEGRFIDVNAAFTNLFGYESDEITGKEVMMLVAPDDRKLVMEHIQSGYEKPYEHKALRKDGSILDVDVCGKTVLIKGEECRITAVRDITERKKAEEKLLDYQAKLNSLASQLSLTEESERRRIATELHDQIGQSLVFSKLKLDELHRTATSSELTKALDEICNNIEQVIQDTRTLTFDLSSPILNEIGLEAAVAEWLDVQIREKHGIETEFVDDGQQKPLDDDIRALLFRNVRELLVNVIKHAEAHKVKVSVRRVNEHIQIDVEDDGKGFDSVQAISTGIEDTKFGLFSIRQRLEQLGGYFEMDSEPGRGSKIMMTAPLKLTIPKK